MNPRQELIGKARAAARRLGKTDLTLREFRREAHVGSDSVYTHFEDWHDLCVQAGLRQRRRNARIADDELYGAMRDVFLETGGIAGNAAFRRGFRYSHALFRRRGMGWHDALRAFRAWAETNAPDFPYLGQLPAGPPPPRRAPGARPRDGREMGNSINFRALQHAPINEHGVILLFGMVAAELGFIVETVASGFPDCEAKRLTAPGRWKRVRIEFEYRSRSFHVHGHDPAGCDLIVCWEHNWPGCPLEVLALDSAIRTLPGGAAGAVERGGEGARGLPARVASSGPRRP